VKTAGTARFAGAGEARFGVGKKAWQCAENFRAVWQYGFWDVEEEAVFAERQTVFRGGLEARDAADFFKLGALCGEMR